MMMDWDRDTFVQQAEQIVRGKLIRDADMAKITWFRTGGAADLLFQPVDQDDLAQFLKILPPDVPLLNVGVGSNLLVRDGGIRGVVIRLSPKGFGSVEMRNAIQIYAGAAVSDKKLSLAARDAGLGGFHFFHGIPGNLGGALRMNAGANGIETAERVVEVYALDRQGRQHILSQQDMGFSYRHTEADSDLIFTGSLLQGEPQDKDHIQAQIDAVIAHREAVQPVREKTGGSTFANPPGLSAWKLIDEAGCRGLTIGDAQISPMHTNFMINKGAATAYELELLGETVRRKVRDHSNAELHWEIKRLGVFEQGRIIYPFLDD